jgi:putative membrane protein insertion efficiency factor
LIAAFLKSLIRLYQIFLSPILVALGVGCRFYPSCSRYAMACVDQDPLPKALIRIARRLGKCGPWHPGGVDLP